MKVRAERREERIANQEADLLDEQLAGVDQPLGHEMTRLRATPAVSWQWQGRTASSKGSEVCGWAGSVHLLGEHATDGAGRSGFIRGGKR